MATTEPMAHPAAIAKMVPTLKTASTHQQGTEVTAKMAVTHLASVIATVVTAERVVREEVVQVGMEALEVMRATAAPVALLTTAGMEAMGEMLPAGMGVTEVMEGSRSGQERVGTVAMAEMAVPQQLAMAGMVERVAGHKEVAEQKGLRASYSLVLTAGILIKGQVALPALEARTGLME